MRIALFCLGWIFILTTPGVLGQQSTPPYQSWEVLQRVPIGEKLKVERKDRKKFSGELVSLSDTELVIKRKGKTVNFQRDEVKKVWWIVHPKSAWDQFENISLGAGIGFLAGIIVLAADLTSSSPDADIVYAAMVSLPIAGAVIGAVLGREKGTLFYFAP